MKMYADALHDAFITLSVLFFFASTTLAAPLDLSFGREDTYSSLASPDGVADTGAAARITDRSNFDDENWLGRRVISEKKIANKVARKQRKTAAKTEVAKAKRKAMKTLNTPPGKRSSCVTTVGRVWLFRNLLAPLKKSRFAVTEAAKQKKEKWQSKQEERAEDCCTNQAL